MMLITTSYLLSAPHRLAHKPLHMLIYSYIHILTPSMHLDDHCMIITSFTCIAHLGFAAARKWIRTPCCFLSPPSGATCHWPQSSTSLAENVSISSSEEIGAPLCVVFFSTLAGVRCRGAEVCCWPVVIELFFHLVPLVACHGADLTRRGRWF